MNRNYPDLSALEMTHDELETWADSHETHPAVALALHAIADSLRSAEDIWEDPTSAEWDQVTTAVEEYVSVGEFEAEDDGRYSWGEEVIEPSRIEPHTVESN